MRSTLTQQLVFGRFPNRYFRALLLLLAFVLAGCTGGIADYSGPDAPQFVPYPADKRPRVALVLGAGGPRGFAHVGVLKVLEANGIQADLVVGASVGALIGALYANGVSAAEIRKSLDRGTFDPLPVEFPAELTAILKQALQANPAERYASATAMLDELTQLG